MQNIIDAMLELNTMYDFHTKLGEDVKHKEIKTTRHNEDIVFTGPRSAFVVTLKMGESNTLGISISDKYLEEINNLSYEVDPVLYIHDLIKDQSALLAHIHKDTFEAFARLADK